MFIRTTAIVFSASLAVAVTASMSHPPTPPPAAASAAYGGQPIAYWQNQEKLFDFADWLSERPEAYDQGLVAVVNDAERLSVKLLWFEGDMEGAGPYLKEARSRGLDATAEPRHHSLAELDATMEHLLASSDAVEEQGLDIEAVVGLQEAVDGVEVVLSETGGQARSASRSAKPDPAMALRSVVGGLPAAVVVTNADGEEYAIPAVTRATDGPPYYAGGLMKNQSGGACSTGFAIRYKSVNRITTARHCKGTFKTYSGGKSYGSTVLNNAAGQARILTGAGSGRAFDGAWNNGSGFNKRVVGYRDVTLGDAVCTSGANSGIHCNVRVSKMKYAFNDGDGSANNIMGTQQSIGKIAAIQGDSGGPVIYPHSGGTTVGAVGMIQGIVTPMKTGSACGSVRLGGANKCSINVLFTSTRTLVNSLSGASLVTQ